MLGIPWKLELPKNNVLRIISEIFYPCRFISPDVIRVKILMQELWGKGLKWDEELPKNLEKRGRTWCSELSEINNFNIQRKLFIMEDISEISLHVFVDVSPKA